MWLWMLIFIFVSSTETQTETDFELMKKPRLTNSPTSDVDDDPLFGAIGRNQVILNLLIFYCAKMFASFMLTMNFLRWKLKLNSIWETFFALITRKLEIITVKRLLDLITSLLLIEKLYLKNTIFF